MALFPALTENADLTPDSALRLPLGAVSPLWFAFAAATNAGVAYWWMTRWTRPANLEAFGDWFSTKAEDAAALVSSTPAIETPVEAALEPLEAAMDAVVETVSALAEPMTDVAEEVSDTTVEAVAAQTEAVTETVEEATEAAVAALDDLTRIVGVGPRLAERLGEIGVKSFKDMAAWTEEDLARIDKDLDLKGRAVRDAWVAQARRFADA